MKAFSRFGNGHHQKVAFIILENPENKIFRQPCRGSHSPRFLSLPMFSHKIAEKTINIGSRIKKSMCGPGLANTDIIESMKFLSEKIKKTRNSKNTMKIFLS